MSEEEALNILGSFTGQISLSRKDHMMIIQAIEVLKKLIEKNKSG